MASVSSTVGAFTLKAYVGDAKTLLAFNLSSKKAAKNLAGFTIEVQPQGGQAYYLLNNLQFEKPGDHAQDSSEPPNSTLNAPIHKFRWLHVPGVAHQGITPFFGPYRYTVTPRTFDASGSMQPLDSKASATIDVDVQPFQSGRVALGFTRGFTQSQAFVHHFGRTALIRPKGRELLFDTSVQSGVNAAGKSYTFQQEYDWLGFTARGKIFALLNEVLADTGIHLDMFAYDLNEPDLLKILLKLADQGRIRLLLDDAALHHSTKSPKPEDQFETMFKKEARGNAGILRGKFGRYAHDKALILSRAGDAYKVLTGSTNFSVTGLYVNSNHVLVFDDTGVATQYSAVFEEAWKDKTQAGAFIKSGLAGKTFTFSSKGVPQTEITFSPHDKAFVTKLLDGIATRIKQEAKVTKSIGSVLFAVMEIDAGTSPVYTALNDLHKQQTVFSFGISDNPAGIKLYTPGSKTGLLVTGKPSNTVLPPPFDQVPGITLGHQVHHKFVVCGFNRSDAVVYCGSSNLASGGEHANGDNLLAIHDSDIATVFAIEALALTDHFNFLDRYAQKSSKGKKRMPPKKPVVSKSQAAVSVKWFLATDDKWAASYFDPDDLHCLDRQLFG